MSVVTYLRGVLGSPSGELIRMLRMLDSRVISTRRDGSPLGEQVGGQN